MTKKEVIKQFTNLKGIGESKAQLLYDNGFTSLDKLHQATPQDLFKIIRCLSNTRKRDLRLL